MSGYPKKISGLCVGVLSGDRVLFQGPADKENGGYKQKILHLTGITAPKVDSSNGKDEKFGYASRQFLRSRLVGKEWPFVIERKAGEIELGYVLVDGKDITIELLSEGLAKLRGDHMNCDHIEQYKNAEVDAQMGERGLWYQDKEPKNSKRFLKLDWTDKDFLNSFRGKIIRAVVEEIHPSKAVLYSEEHGWMGTVNFSEVQVVVLSDKQEGTQKKTSNVKAIRSTIESSFLHREVDLIISGLEQGLQGYFTHGEEDIRKTLLRHGYAKLAKDAMNGISTKQFMELKIIAQQALEQGKGLWKEQKVVKSETINSKSYMATVCEINSGDSITVCTDKNEFNRIYLPNIRAPTQGQSFSFEAKEALRRRIIGNKVRVQVEFSKKINVKKFEGDNGELRPFIFASVFDGATNISAYLLEQGLVNFQTPRVEEDVTKYLEALRDAEAKGKKDKKGMHGNFDAKPPTFNDLSGGKGKKVDAAKCKNIFPFIKDEKNLTGIIDLVLNGSRFKMRFNNQHVMVIMVLEGVRCLPNEGSFAKASEEALQYSKLHANQRDAEVDLKSVDLKGIFHGKVYINKKDYALELLERGLAICMGGKNRNPRYEEAESIARKNKIGLWRHNLNLTSIKGEIQKQYKSISATKNLTLLEVLNASEFYLEPENAKRPKIPQNPKPVGQVEVGGLYVGKFTDDDTYYRARILRDAGGNKYHVIYIDFGNVETIHKDRLGVLPEELKSFKSPLYKCGLYGVGNVTGEGLNILKDYVGAHLKVEFRQELVPQGKEEIDYRVILSEKGENLNLLLLQYGEGQCTCDDAEWRRVEEKAQQLREGKWGKEDEGL